MVSGRRVSIKSAFTSIHFGDCGPSRSNISCARNRTSSGADVGIGLAARPPRESTRLGKQSNLARRTEQVPCEGRPLHTVLSTFIPMHSCSELIQLSSDCHERILHQCTMRTIQSLCCTCSKWNKIVVCASQYDHRLWSICVTLQKPAPVLAVKCIQPTQSISNVLHHLLHLCPETCLHAFYVHIYIWHRLPPDLPWALHEVQHMVGIDIARDPFGILGLKGYFRALQKECTRMKQHPRPPNEESSMWRVMAQCIHLPAVQAVCKVLQLMDEQSLPEYLALRSELFSWVDVICAYLHVDEDDWTHPQPYCIEPRWSPASRRARSVKKYLTSLFYRQCTRFALPNTKQ